MPDTLAEKLYYRLPIALQHAAFSFHGLRVARLRYGSEFRKKLDWLTESQWWSQQQILEYQETKLRNLVRHCYETVPFYRKWFDDANVGPPDIRGIGDLAKLPVLTKTIVRQEAAELVSRAYPKRRLTPNLTSGTTGTPLSVWSLQEGLNFQWAVWWRHKGRFGLKPGDNHAVFGARVAVSHDQTEPPFWRHDWLGKRTYMSSYHVTPANLKPIVDFLNRSQFAFYAGYPSILVSLANLIKDYGLQIDVAPKAIVTGSDVLLPSYEARLREVFHAPVTEQYGMAEFAGNLSKCEFGRFHADFETGIVETIPLPGGAPNAVSLVLTGWGNAAMPFLRYEIGDYATLESGPCPCGRHSMSFSMLDGRMEEYVRTPDGGRVIGLNQVFEYASHAREIQVFQKEIEAIEVRIVKGPDFGQGDVDALEREFRRRLGGRLRISYRFVEKIDRGKNGKYRAVLSTLPALSREELALRRAVDEGLPPQ